MMGRLAGSAGVLAATCVLMAAPAGATPEPAAQVDCNFTLSAPYVVDVAGTQMVTATVVPAACPDAVPTVLQACLSVPGKVGRCDNTDGNTMSQVYLSPYVPGMSYTARGRGCAAVPSPPTMICSSLGPTEAVL
ncbi:MAG: hypothetical protein WBB07_04225 [Mycobacterium sp.]